MLPSFYPIQPYFLPSFLISYKTILPSFYPIQPYFLPSILDNHTSFLLSYTTMLPSSLSYTTILPSFYQLILYNHTSFLLSYKTILPSFYPLQPYFLPSILYNLYFLPTWEFRLFSLCHSQATNECPQNLFSPAVWPL